MTNPACAILRTASGAPVRSLGAAPARAFPKCEQTLAHDPMQPPAMPTSPLRRPRCVALQGLRTRASRRLGWHAVMLLLAAFALLVQGIALVGERASGTAHVHIGEPGHGLSELDDHAQLHALGVAHHDHDAGDTTVFTLDDADDDAGLSGAAKRLPLDQGAVSDDWLLRWPATAAVRWAVEAPARFASRTPLPLERPPR